MKIYICNKFRLDVHVAFVAHFVNVRLNICTARVSYLSFLQKSMGDTDVLVLLRITVFFNNFRMFCFSSANWDGKMRRSCWKISLLSTSRIWCLIPTSSSSFKNTFLCFWNIDVLILSRFNPNGIISRHYKFLFWWRNH